MLLQATVKENDVKMIVDNDLVSKPEPEVIIDHPFFHSKFHQAGIIINFSWAGWSEVNIAQDARNGSCAKALIANMPSRSGSRLSSSASRSSSEFSRSKRSPGRQQPGLGASPRCWSEGLWKPRPAGRPPETEGGEGGDKGFCLLRTFFRILLCNC